MLQAASIVPSLPKIQPQSRRVESLLIANESKAVQLAPKRTRSIPKHEAGNVFAMKKALCCTFLLVSVSLSLLSCGGGHDSNSGGVACEAQRGTSCQSLTINGVTRTYLLHVPANFQKNNGALVIVLHGSGGNGLGMEIGTGFSTLADQAGFAVAYPDGLLESSSGQTNWAYFFSDFTDDVSFFRQFINTLQASVDPDPRRIYITGLSSGALMSHRLGVQLSELVAGIGVVEGALFLKGNPPPVHSPVGPVSVLILHGDQDKTVLYCGTPVDASQEQSFNYWAGTSADSCSSLDTTLALCDGQRNISAVVEKDATNCSGNTEVKFYKLIGGVHTWYTVPMNVSSQVPFNPDFNSNTGITTTDILWSFFATHLKR
jgi:polyhydroxybutyrate depolymerase